MHNEIIEFAFEIYIPMLVQLSEGVSLRIVVRGREQFCFSHSYCSFCKDSIYTCSYDGQAYPTTNGEADSGGKVPGASKFEMVIVFVRDYLHFVVNDRSSFADPSQNKLTYEVSDPREHYFVCIQ